MEEKVLVAYATKYGATQGIAERVGQTLREAGLQVDVLPADRAGDPGTYAAVVLGSGVYMGQWRKPARAYLEANEQALAGRPVWLFSDGPTAAGDPAALLKGWRFPQALQPVADRIHPRDIAVFGGALDAQKISLFEKLILKIVKAPAGDYRDWNAITAWARGIAAALTGKPAA